MIGDIDDLLSDAQKQLDKLHDLIESTTKEYNIPTSITLQMYSLLQGIYTDLDQIEALSEDMIRRPPY